MKREQNDAIIYNFQQLNMVLVKKREQLPVSLPIQSLVDTNCSAYYAMHDLLKANYKCGGT